MIGQTRHNKICSFVMWGTTYHFVLASRERLPTAYQYINVSIDQLGKVLVVFFLAED